MTSTPLVVSLALAALLGGCAISWPTSTHTQAAAAGYTGCQPETNEISNVKETVGRLQWNATCQGKRYLCSEVVDGNGRWQYSCAPAVD